MKGLCSKNFVSQQWQAFGSSVDSKNHARNRKGLKNQGQQRFLGVFLGVFFDTEFVNP
jgi:hypothetical protein